MKTRKESYTNFDIEYELTDLPLTALGGAPVFIEAAKALVVYKLFYKQLSIKLRNRGYTEYELALAVILTQLSGGESLEDADKIRMDEVVGWDHFPHSTAIGDILSRFTEEAVRSTAARPGRTEPSDSAADGLSVNYTRHRQDLFKPVKVAYAACDIETL